MIFKKMQKMKSKKGFTLIELIVVIAIIGILAAIAIPSLSGFRQNAALQADQATGKVIATATATAIANGEIDATAAIAEFDLSGANANAAIILNYLQALPEDSTGADGWGVAIAAGGDVTVQTEGNVPVFPAP